MFYSKCDSTVYFFQSSETTLNDIQMRLSILRLLKFFLNETHLAIQAFCRKDYVKFDAQVGENLCQLRAYQVYLLAEQYTKLKKNNELQQEGLCIINHFNKCCDLIVFYENLIQEGSKGDKKNYYLHVPLKKFLCESELFFILSDEVFFLFQAHLLARFSVLDENRIPQSMDLVKLQKYMGCSIRIAKRVLHYVQKNVAATSSRFVFYLFDKVLLPDYTKDLLLSLYKIADEGRPVLPCYDSMKILFAHMLKKNCLLCVVVYGEMALHDDKILMLFKPNSYNDRYEICTNLTEYLAHPCVVIEGVANGFDLGFFSSKQSYQTNFIKKGIEQVLMANMAAHPQYTGKVLCAFEHNPYYQLIMNMNESSKPQPFTIEKLKALETELKDMQQLAQVGGFCRDNSNFLLIRHIFCSRFADELAKVKESSILQKEIAIMA